MKAYTLWLGLLLLGLAGCGEDKTPNVATTPQAENPEAQAADEQADTAAADEPQTATAPTGEGPAQQAAQATPPASKQVDGPAQLQFATLKDVFGLRPVGDSVVTYYPYQNVGTKPISITKAKPTCSCTGVQYPTGTIAPGARGKIRVSYPTVGKEGQFANKSVFIFTDADKKPIELKFSLEVEEK